VLCSSKSLLNTRVSAEKIPGGGGGKRKKQGRKIVAPFSLPLLYHYHVWKSRGGARLPPAPRFRRPWLNLALCSAVFTKQINIRNRSSTKSKEPKQLKTYLLLTFRELNYLIAKAVKTIHVIEIAFCGYCVIRQKKIFQRALFRGRTRQRAYGMRSVLTQK